MDCCSAVDCWTSQRRCRRMEGAKGSITVETCLMAKRPRGGAVYDVSDHETATQVEDQSGCPECRRCDVPGTAAWDGCEDPCSGAASGQLTVNVTRIYPSTTTFPSPDQTVRDLRNCQPPPVTAVEMVVTLLRCAPGPTEEGCPPGCDDLSEAARVLHVDALTAYSALLPAGGRWGRRGRQVVAVDRLRCSRHRRLPSGPPDASCPPTRSPAARTPNRNRLNPRLSNESHPGSPGGVIAACQSGLRPILRSGSRNTRDQY